MQTPKNNIFSSIKCVLYDIFISTLKSNTTTLFYNIVNRCKYIYKMTYIVKNY